MKSRTSFFNATVLKKDILRFAPLWGIYIVYLFFTHIFYYDYAGNPYTGGVAYYFATSSPPVNLYCFLCATFLFGDLFKRKACYTLHSMPLRRETWLFTHIAAGLLFIVVPHTLCAGFMAVILKEQAFLALLWWLIMLGKTLFHFALAVFCVMCVGNRLGHLAIFLFLSYFSGLIQVVYDCLYDPLLFGIPSDNTIFDLLCPALHWSSDNFFRFTHFSAMSSAYGSFVYTYKGLNVPMWVHLGIFTALSVPLTLGSLWIYRHKDLETTGDFVTAKFFRWVFLIFASIFLGAVLPYWGLPIGFFGISMLMERSLKVFGKKQWIRFGCLVGAVALTVGLTYLDPMGIVERVPETQDIKTVKLEKYKDFDDGGLLLTKSQHIDAVRELHNHCLNNRDEVGTYYFDVVYTLNNGKTIHRQYYMDVAHTLPLRRVLSSFDVLFGVEDAQALKQELTSVVIESTTGSGINHKVIRQTDFDAFIQALEEDAGKGLLAQDIFIHPTSSVTRTAKFYFTNGNVIELELYTASKATHTFINNYQ